MTFVSDPSGTYIELSEGLDWHWISVAARAEPARIEVRCARSRREGGQPWRRLLP